MPKKNYQKEQNRVSGNSIYYTRTAQISANAWSSNIMYIKTYRVLTNFDVIDHSKIILKQYLILKNLKKGDIIQSKDLTKYAKMNTIQSKQKLVQHALKKAQDIGMIVDTNTRCSISEFREFETVSYWANQLKQPQTKNIKKETNQGTQYSYVSNACAFHNWLIGKNFTYKNTIHTGPNTFETMEDSVELDGLEHLLKLYQKSYNSEMYFIKIIKQYLMDPIHEGKKSAVINIAACAIKSYFAKNESAITFSFDCEINYENTKSNMEQTSLTLEEIFMMLTVGKPNIMERALILCKFHRGLDNITFADSFNYEAWQQLVDYFGTSDFTNWNTTKCPVPIKLLRVKTQYIHTGFLDVDAIDALKIYLKYRLTLTNKPMAIGQPLFITSKIKPVSQRHVYRIVRTLLKNSGLQEVLDNYAKVVKYKRNSHEFRDTLKSTLIASGCRIDIADHVIGHSPKDSYEKQTELFPKQMRDEFHKASRRLNMFSNMSENIQGNNSDIEIDEIRLEHQKKIDSLKRENHEIRASLDDIMRRISINEDAILPPIH